MDKPKTVLLTSNARRHRYVAMQIAQGLDLVGVVSEAKLPVVKDESALPDADRAVIEQHLGEREAAEARLLGEVDVFPTENVLPLERGQANSQATFDWVQNLQPDVLVLYGTGIIKPPLLDAYENRIVNLHLGLSPYYRGSGTNFHPLVNNQPELVGATIHLAVLDVDAGSILGQVRPTPAITDRAHELGTKTIMAAAQALPRLVKGYLAGHITPQTQDLSTGEVYKRKDFTAEKVRQMWQNFDDGMIDAYIADVDARQAQYPIVKGLS